MPAAALRCGLGLPARHPPAAARDDQRRVPAARKRPGSVQARQSTSKPLLMSVPIAPTNSTTGRSAGNCRDARAAVRSACIGGTPRRVRSQIDGANASRGDADPLDHGTPRGLRVRDHETAPAAAIRARAGAPIPSSARFRYRLHHAAPSSLTGQAAWTACTQLMSGHAQLPPLTTTRASGSRPTTSARDLPRRFARADVRRAPAGRAAAARRARSTADRSTKRWIDVVADQMHRHAGLEEMCRERSVRAIHPAPLMEAAGDDDPGRDVSRAAIVDRRRRDHVRRQALAAGANATSGTTIQPVSSRTNRGRWHGREEPGPDQAGRETHTPPPRRPAVGRNRTCRSS